MNQHIMPLYQALKEYHDRQVLPFDVPGHKQGRGIQELAELFGEKVLNVDVNSMKCLDHLGHPTGVIEKAQQLMADAFGAEDAYFMVNGATSGVMSMIQAVCKPGDEIILPRNCHKSAFNGIIQSGAVPIYLMPEVDTDTCITMPISFEQVKEAIDRYPKAKALFLLNPTYFGLVTELKKIVDYAHQHNMIVIVDEAHGSHFHFHRELPMSAMEAGADISCISMHKTGGSLTQSSVVLRQGNKVCAKYLKRVINLTQSTSASYLLLTSLDVARKKLATEGESLMSSIIDLADYAKKRIHQETNFEVVGNRDFKRFQMDPTKLVIKSSHLGMRGVELYNQLRDDYNIQLELGDEGCSLAILSLGDNQEMVDGLLVALKQIDGSKDALTFDFEWSSTHVKRCDLPPREGFYANKQSVPIEEAIGMIAGENIMAYPPGIPVVLLGEAIQEEAIAFIQEMKASGIMMTDMNDETLSTILVIENRT